MNRQRTRRPFVGANRAPRIRRMHAASRPARPDLRPRAVRAGEDAAIALLSEILIGDCTWTLAEVRRLIEIRESAEAGR